MSTTQTASESLASRLHAPGLTGDGFGGFLCPMTRKPISKGTRFKVFSRDGFTCRYCGCQSDTAPLVVDHVIPVCQGGTNDIENLLTACQPCNAGKAGKTPTQAAPTEEDRLRLAQERNEQIQAFAHAQEAMEARREMRQSIVNYWCECTGRSTVDSSTIAVVFSYVCDLGVELVCEWIEKAADRTGHCDLKMGRYVSGIRRSYLEQLLEQ